MNGSYPTRNDTKLTMCWSRDETCLLLKILRNYPILYDHSDPAYELQSLRTKVYQQISDELKVYKPDVSPLLVRNKFKVLKQQYLFEKKMKEEFLMRRKKPDATYKPKLWCYPLMDFFEEKTVCSRGKRRAAKKPAFSTILLNQNEDCTEIEGSETFEDNFWNDLNQNETLTPTPVSSRNIVNAKCLQLVDDLVKTFKEIKEEREKEVEKSSDESPQTFLGMMVESELSKVNEQVYDEAKWKIIRILEEASKRHRAVKNKAPCQFKAPPLPMTILPSKPGEPTPNKQFYLGKGIQLVMIKSPETQTCNTTKFKSIRTNYNGLNK